jgi:CO/xanthine dehydrogenase FAD-binding subunit
LDQAVAALAQGRLTVLAGGTDIYPAHVARPIREDVLDIGGLEELTGIDESDDSYRIGAATPWRYLINNDLPPLFAGLIAAAREVGGWQVQHAGTIAGNICNASPAADGMPMLMAMDAYVELSSMHGVRKLPVSEFVLGNRRTAIFSDELLSAVIIPKAKNAAVSGFQKLGARCYLVISIVSVAGTMEFDRAGIVTSARFAVGSCSEVAERLPVLEHAILGRNRGTDFSTLVAAHQFSHLRPIDDIRAPATYRLEAAETLTKRLLTQLGGQDG